jgi:peptide/nickel transport system permease protein
MLLTRILRRVLLTLIIVFGVTVIAFLLVRLTPGDPARIMLAPTAKEADVQAMRTRMGLDKPYIVQYGLYLDNLLHGDLGYSYVYKSKVSELIFPRLLRTAEITALGVIIALLISLPLGVIAGIKRGS